MWRFALFVGFVCLSVQTTGQTYFQQEVNSVIHVRLDDVNHRLSGDIRMAYINHSPDTLNHIFIHHWPNAYSSPESALARQFLRQGDFLFNFSPTDNMGIINGLDYKVNNTTAPFNSNETPVDYIRLPLPAPLLTGDTAFITTPFVVNLPSADISRLGHIGQAYYITQWFPKPAVYDQNGWNAMPYLNQGEFYSEFGSYEVHLDVPANYVVMASGKLENESERVWLKQLDEITRDKASFLSDMSFPPSSDKRKTLIYTAQNVHDFAWFADKRYHVLYDEVFLPESNKKVEIWTAFTNTKAKLWTTGPDGIKKALRQYSVWLGDYPYSSFTVVDGLNIAGRDMEYPMITVLGTPINSVQFDLTIAHELGHNWFQGAIANNERKHPWLDEGINSGVELRYQSAIGSQGSKNVTQGRLLNLINDPFWYKKQGILRDYRTQVRQHRDQPMSLCADEYTTENYYNIVYGKGALVQDYLRAYIGDSAFDSTLQNYYTDRKNKHAHPEHYLSAVQGSLGEAATWFEDLIYTTKAVDFKAQKLQKRSVGNYELTIRSLGKVKGPVNYSLLLGDSVLTETWIPPFKKDTTLTIFSDAFDRVVIDYNDYTLDINRKNNQIKKEGILKKAETFKLQLFTGYENDSENTLYYAPLLGYNTADQLLAGVLVHNVGLFQKKYEFRAAPMWGFGSRRLNWMAAVRHNLRLNNSSLFENLWVELNTQSFSTRFGNRLGYFERAQLAVNADFNKHPMSRSLSHHAYADLTYLSVEPFSTSNLGYELFGRLQYRAINNYPIRPYEFSALFDIHRHFVRVGVELNNHFVFNQRNRKIHTRLFAGMFLFNQSNSAVYNLRMGGIDGSHDFRYDHTFVGRFEQSGMAAQQFVHGMGGFNIPTAAGQSNNWLAAANIKVEAPFRIPMGIFVDIGFSDSSRRPISDLLYTSGFYVWLVKDAVEIYFPIPVSVFTAEDIQNEIAVNNTKYYQLVRFMINFNEINPFKLLRERHN